MDTERTQEVYGFKGKRLHLHPCHLQGMQGDAFVHIANRVLRGEITLLSNRGEYSTGTAAGAAAN